MYKLAYIKGVAQAFKDAGLVKLAISDDVELEETGSSAPVEKLEGVLKKLDEEIGSKASVRQSPDNVTKDTKGSLVGNDESSRGVTWSPDTVPGATTDAFSINTSSMRPGEF